MGDQNFQKIFKSNLQEFIDEAFKLVPNTATKKRELVQCIKYSLICKNPQSTFLWKEDDISSSDFHDFYDEYDNKSEQQLIEEVTKDLKTEETKWFLPFAGSIFLLDIYLTFRTKIFLFVLRRGILCIMQLILFNSYSSYYRLKKSGLND